MGFVLLGFFQLFAAHGENFQFYLALLLDLGHFLNVLSQYLVLLNHRDVLAGASIRGRTGLLLLFFVVGLAAKSFFGSYSFHYTFIKQSRVFKDCILPNSDNPTILKYKINKQSIQSKNFLQYLYLFLYKNTMQLLLYFVMFFLLKWRRRGIRVQKRTNIRRINKVQSVLQNVFYHGSFAANHH